jgi:hypothetical protein
MSEAVLVTLWAGIMLIIILGLALWAESGK